MATINIDVKCDLNKPVVVRHLDGMVFSQDVKANRIRVSAFRDGSPVDLSSGSVSANIIRADGATVVQTGTIDENVCSVVLPSSAYAVPGAIAIFVKHTNSGTTSTIAAITGYVYKSTTDTIVDPGTVVPNVNQLLAMIEDCEDATAACIAATAAAPVIDDTAGAGATNKVWSASKTTNEISNVRNNFDNAITEGYRTNMLDEANITPWSSDSDYSDAVVYLNGYTGDLVVSTAGTYHAYFRTPYVKDINGNTLTSGWLSGTVYNSDQSRSGKTITIPSGGVVLEFAFRNSASGSPLVHDVMVTKGTTCPETYEPYELTRILNGSPYVKMDEVGDERVYYVSLSGNDSNDGLSVENAFATLKKAIESGAHKIKMQRGIYYNAGSTVQRFSNINGLSIQPYDNNQTFAVSVPEREHIRLYGGKKILLSEVTENNGVYQFTLDSGGLYYTEVFISKSMQPVINENYNLFRANIDLIYADITKKHRIKPVLTLAECQSTPDSFFWDGETCYFNAQDSTFSEIIIPTAASEILSLTECSNIHLEDIEFSFGFQDCLKLVGCENVELKNCSANYSSIAMGFMIDNTNAILENCYATHNAYDGFNFHSYGTTVLNDCIAEYNYDDGCSHHNGCIGIVNGGRYEGNGKGGITPAYGALVDCYNALCINNNAGIAYLTTNNGHRSMTGTVSGCVMAGNAKGLSVNALATVTAWGNKYANNTTDKDVNGTLIDYDS